jgi:hypothetical protein
MNIKDNKTIAEFMGMEFGEDGTMCYDDAENRHPPTPTDMLAYNSEWDWLMPVVDKIESMRDKDGNAYRFSIEMCNAEIENTNIQVLGERYKIDAVYKVAVKFIRAVHTLKIKN